jgi:hypothetical protein
MNKWFMQFFPAIAITSTLFGNTAFAAEASVERMSVSQARRTCNKMYPSVAISNGEGGLQYGGAGLNGSGGSQKEYAVTVETFALMAAVQSTCRSYHLTGDDELKEQYILSIAALREHAPFNEAMDKVMDELEITKEQRDQLGIRVRALEGKLIETDRRLAVELQKNAELREQHEVDKKLAYLQGLQKAEDSLTRMLAAHPENATVQAELNGLRAYIEHVKGELEN